MKSSENIWDENLWNHLISSSELFELWKWASYECPTNVIRLWLLAKFAFCLYGRKSTDRTKLHSHLLKWRHFSLFWQNAKTCWDGPDKMPTKNWDGQNANHNKSLDNMPTFRWHFVRTLLDSGTDHICRAFLRCDLACEVLNSKLECLNSCIDHTWTTFPQNGP